ncbi:hypothetical protein [Nocardia fusca]|uniref:hypothetical protein n=1 Tax=Nocardia fusca TaxID=941183 RepID=UPI0007A74E79|nr:hypothetical protein [Nocardia fusca]
MLAGQVNRLRVAGPEQGSLVEVYAEMVLAYARLRRRELDDPVRIQIIDHLTERVDQAQLGQIGLAVADLADRLHAELTR